MDLSELDGPTVVEKTVNVDDKERTLEDPGRDRELGILLLRKEFYGEKDLDKKIKELRDE